MCFRTSTLESRCSSADEETSLFSTWWCAAFKGSLENGCGGGTGCRKGIGGSCAAWWFLKGICWAAGWVGGCSWAWSNEGDPCWSCCSTSPEACAFWLSSSLAALDSWTFWAHWDQRDRCIGLQSEIGNGKLREYQRVKVVKHERIEVVIIWDSTSGCSKA